MSKLEEKYFQKIGENVYEFFFENKISEGNKKHVHFEFREGQAEMACEIVDAVMDKKNLVVEAGVGIGKSFAYLLPLIYYNYYLKKPVVIATSTIALQEQLKNDIKFIMDKLNLYPKVLVAKGMTNFICKFNFKEFFYNRNNLKEYSQIYEVINIGGSELGDWNIKIPKDLWEKFRIKKYNYRECRYCEYRDVCHYYQLRMNLRKTKGIIICNQDMLIMDLRLKREMQEGLFTDELALLVIDEAHNLESKVRSSYTDTLTKKRIYYAIKACYHKIKKVPLTLEKNINILFLAIDKVFFQIKSQVKEQIQIAKKQHQDADRFKVEVPFDLLKQIINISTELMIAHVVSMKRTGGRTSEEIEYIIDFFNAWYNTKENIVWAENPENLILYCCPKFINTKIDDLFFGEISNFHKDFITIFTSATLTNSFDKKLENAYGYFIKNTMLPLTKSILAEPKGSPFSYDEHTMIFYTDILPNPSNNRFEFLEKSIPLIINLIKISDGKAMILFTSKSDMRNVYQKLKNADLPYKLIKQNEFSSQQQLLDTFKKDINSVLLGTGSFWEGINIEGASLSNLIIYKLPFPVPDPIIEEKCKFSKNPMQDVLVPEMIIKLKQGVGRLIRSETDKGIVSIIDPRLGNKFTFKYKKEVWKSLPIKNKTTDIDELRDFYLKVIKK